MKGTISASCVGIASKGIDCRGSALWTTVQDGKECNDSDGQMKGCAGNVRDDDRDR